MSESDKKSDKLRRVSNPAHETITLKLREYYDAVKEEAIPDHFLDLLERLDAADAAFKNQASAEQAAESAPAGESNQ